MATAESQAATAEQPAAAPRGRMLAKLAAVVVVSVIAIVEIVVAWLYLPSASASQQQAQQALETQVALIEPEPTPPAAELKEVDLGSFTVTAYQPASNIVLRIDFHLYGTILLKDEAAFVTVMESSGNRVRDSVITTIRTVNLSDLNDAGLGLIKRRVLETTNRLLGKPFLQTVLFSEFTFTEQ